MWKELLESKESDQNVYGQRLYGRISGAFSPTEDEHTEL